MVSALGQFRSGSDQVIPALAGALRDRESSVRNNAVLALAGFGPEAKDSVPELIEAMLDPVVCPKAAFALGRIGPAANEAVPVLTELLKDQDETIRSSAAAALGKIGPDAKEAVPGLIVALQDPQPIVGVSAAISLGEIGPDAEEAIPALEEATRHWDEDVREFSGNALPLIRK